jgi:hypothetical protein
LNARCADITCLIKRTPLKLISLIHRTRHFPITTIRRSCVAALKRAVHEEVDARDADVVAGGRRDWDGCFARNGPAVRVVADGDVELAGNKSV